MKYLSLYVQYEIVGSGLEKITQIAVDNGYSDNQPFSYMWDDKDHKTDCQHPDCLCSGAYPHQPSDNRQKKHQPGKQIEDHRGKLREEDACPL